MKVTIKEATPTPPPKVVVLELTEREAAALYALSLKIGGSLYGPRSVTDNISRQLAELFPSINSTDFFEDSSIYALKEWPAKWRNA
jgi:hypothetical protein